MATKPTASIEWRTPNTGATTPITTVTANITRIAFNTGRTQISDYWTNGTCTVSGRGFLSSTPAIGDYARVKIFNGTDYAFFYGVIGDYQKTYGLSSAYDSFDLRIDGPMSTINRTYTNMNWSAGYLWAAALAYGALSISPTQIRIPGGNYSNTEISAINSTEIYGNITEKVVTTNQAVIRETGDEDWPGAYNLSPVINIYDRNDTTYLYQNIGTVSDTGGAGESPFVNITFNSTSYNYATKVVVEPDGLAAQSSGSGIYTLQFQTMDNTTTQAANLAGYIKTSLDNAGVVPNSVTIDGASAASGWIAKCRPSNIKNKLTVKLRGNTYNCVVEGIEFDADPTSWRCTFYLSSDLQNAFLRLDDAVFGKLDTNKLGF